MERMNSSIWKSAIFTFSIAIIWFSEYEHSAVKRIEVELIVNHNFWIPVFSTILQDLELLCGSQPSLLHYAPRYLSQVFNINLTEQSISALNLMTCDKRITPLLFHTVFTFVRLSRLFLLLSCIVDQLFAPCLSFCLLEHVHTYVM